MNGEESADEFICVERWLLDRSTNMAEVAFTVHPDWQRKGLGTVMLKKLIEIAQEKGIRGFTAEVLTVNRKMLNVFHKSGCKINIKLEDDVYYISFVFDEKA